MKSSLGVARWVVIRFGVLVGVFALAFSVGFFLPGCGGAEGAASSSDRGAARCEREAGVASEDCEAEGVAIDEPRLKPARTIGNIR